MCPLRWNRNCSSTMTKYTIPTLEFLEEYLLPFMKRKEKIRMAKKLEALARKLRESAEYKEEV